MQIVELLKPKYPAVTRAAENQVQDRIIGLSAPFCPQVFLLSVHPSGRWLVGAVGIETIHARHFNDLRSRARIEKEGLGSPWNRYCRRNVAFFPMML